MEPIRTSAVVTMVQENDGHTNLVYGTVRLEGECDVGMDGAEDGHMDPITVYWKAPISERVRIGQSVAVDIRLSAMNVISVIPNAR